ncbi:hypothetical protein BCD49_00965 [Pseudofrankia sp. EUN1h]|nr:hypothetical protein BCD49_00965 [Pseudofrankia sp. EUN1h]
MSYKRIRLAGTGATDNLIYFVGTATTIIHQAGFTVLTDPNYLQRGQRADLMELIEPHTTVPIHYDDYGVFRSPLADFENEVRTRDLTGRVRFLDRGDALPLPAVATHP